MRLGEFVTIIRRWWILLVVPTMMITIVGLIFYEAPSDRYVTTVHLSAALTPDENMATNITQFDTTYYSWLSSEYLVSGLSDWSVTGAFATAVSKLLESDSTYISASRIQNSLSSDYVRSEVVIYVNSIDPDHTSKIANAAIKVMQEKNKNVFPQLGGRNATVVPLDEPIITLASPGITQYLEIFVRITTGLVLGLLLVLCGHFFDPYIRNRSDVEMLGIQVIMENTHQ